MSYFVINYYEFKLHLGKQIEFIVTTAILTVFTNLAVSLLDPAILKAYFYNNFITLNDKLLMKKTI